MANLKKLLTKLSGVLNLNRFYKTGLREKSAMPAKSVTISDVARLAGVSKGTVSHILKGDTHYIRQETQDRVRQAIAELNYRPSSVARSLVSKRTQTMGLLISDVGNPFFADVIRGVEDTAVANGYNIFLTNTGYDLERGMTSLRLLIDKQVDGVLIMSSSPSYEWVRELVSNRVPVVVSTDNFPENHSFDLPGDGGIGYISIDFGKGITAAADHLVALGHRRIAHLGGPEHLLTTQARQAAFLNALALHGVPTGHVAMLNGNFRMDGGRQAFRQLINLPERPTAVFADNDLMAIGLIWEARQHGMNVPEDLSVIGLDDIELAAGLVPALTTVALPRYDIGAQGMKLLLDLINITVTGGSAAPVFSFESRLVVRDSTALPKPIH